MKLKKKPEISTSMKRKLDKDDDAIQTKILKLDEYVNKPEIKVNLNKFSNKHTQIKPKFDPKAQAINSNHNTKSKIRNSQLLNNSKANSAAKIKSNGINSNSKLLRNYLKPDEIQPSGKRIKPEAGFNNS